MTEIVQASRLLSILMLLQARQRVSATELAAHAEVSVRTIYRDVEQLSAAGVPVYADRGRSGGFRLLEGWRTTLTGLTEAEAQAMFLTGLPGPATELGLGEALATAQLKLAAALPIGWQADAQRVSSRVHLDTTGWYRVTTPADHLALVAAAVWADEVLRVRYDSWSGVSDRELRPLGLVIKGGAWYVVATRVGGGVEPQTYRLSNILDAESTGRHFRRPARFDLAAYWDRSTREFEATIYRSEALVRVTDRGLHVLARMNSAVAAVVDRAVPDGTGWHRLHIPIESAAHAAEDLLGLGTDVEVLDPPSLRAVMAATARDVLALYS